MNATTQDILLSRPPNIAVMKHMKNPAYRRVNTKTMSSIQRYILKINLLKTKQKNLLGSKSI